MNVEEAIGWQSTPAGPRHTNPLLQLLPSGPGWVCSLSLRGDQCRSPYCRTADYAGKSAFSQEEIYNMPFTLSHTVAAIPLKKQLGQYGCLSALFIGAMVPDFVYMFPQDFVRYHGLTSHSFIGLFKVCLPIGVIFFYLYHLLMAPVIVAVFPESLKRKLPRHLSLGQCPPLNNGHAIIISLLIGSVTHIVWDAFTHERAIPQYIELLRTPLATIDNWEIMPFRVIQHLSTVLGLMLLLWWIWRWYCETPAQDKIAWQPTALIRKITLAILVLIPTIVGLYFAYTNTPDNKVLFGLHDLQLGLKFGIVSGAIALIITSSILGIFYQWMLFRQRSH